MRAARPTLPLSDIPFPAHLTAQEPILRFGGQCEGSAALQSIGSSQISRPPHGSQFLIPPDTRATVSTSAPNFSRLTSCCLCSGQTAANKSFIVQGQQDVPLSDAGREQARRLAAHFRTAGVRFDTVFSSDLSRAQETCQILTDGQRMTIDMRLRERGYGVMEGKNLQDLRAAAKAAGFSDKNCSSYLPPGAESLEQVRSRIQDFCCNHLIPNAAPDQNVLLVTHGGVIREFMRFFRDQVKCQLTGLHEPLQVTPNTGVSCFRISYLCKALSDGKMRQTMTEAECLKVHEISHLEPVDGSAATAQPVIPSRDLPAAAALPLSEVAPPLEAL